jgi:abequosyltransferase
MENITLSICIATRNRADTLRHTLDSIIQQAEHDIEIIIVDGNSQDNTEQVAAEYKKRFTHLHYLRLSQNGGVDRDYSKTVELAHGEYCWFMSDDDILKQGAISAILRHIHHKYDLIIVNSESRTKDLQRILVQQNTVRKVDKVYSSQEYDSLFVEAASHLSYIPSVVIKKTIWQERDKEPYYGSLFVHVGVIFQKRLEGNTLFLAEPLISVRRGNVTWGSKVFEIWLFKWPLLIWSFPLFSDTLKQAVVKKEQWKRLCVLLRFRASYCYFLEDYNKWLAQSTQSRWYKLGAKRIAQLPIGILSILLILYLFVFEPRSKGSIYEIIMNSQFRKIFRLQEL